MSEFRKFLAESGTRDFSRLHTAILAEILTYDPVLMQADLQPLIRDPDLEYAPIVHASVSSLRAGGFVIRPPYQPGDIVVAVVIERGIDGVFATGGMADRVGARKHSLTDAIVVGGFTPRPRPLPEAHGADLLISTENGVNKIVMDQEGNITVYSEGIVNIDAQSINLNSGSAEEEPEEEP